LTNAISTTHSPSDFNDIITYFYFDSKLGNGCLRWAANEEFVNIGIASLSQRKANIYMSIKEPICIRVLGKVYENFYRINFSSKIKEKLLMFLKSGGKGIIFEMVCAFILKQKNGEKLKNFLEDLFNDKMIGVNLPSWANNAVLNIESVGEAKALGFDDDLNCIQFMVLNRDHGLLLRPNPQVRADILSFNLLEDKYLYWVFACSTKMYSKKVDIPNDRSSTDPDKFYYKEDGSGVNPTCKEIEKNYRSITKSNNLRRVGSFRMHIILPESKQFEKELEVIGEDIVVYVNLKRFEKFCYDKELWKVIKECY